MTTPQTTPIPLTERCHCGHTEAEHDPVAARYCQATMSEVLRRGCTCFPAEPAPPRIYGRA